MVNSPQKNPPRFDPGETADLPARVHSRLARSPHFLGRNLQVEMSGDDVVLRGVVETYYQKQLAQEFIREIDGVGNIRNEIEVHSPPPRVFAGQA
ncbi:MAG: BON domain-containing protein [Planctomycetes bacterium]|nr:BON domain-containing protein [Planctomycetota bacterium]